MQGAWARTPGDSLVTPAHGLAGLAAAGVEATPRPPTASVLRSLATRKSLAAQATPLQRDVPAGRDTRQDAVGMEASSAPPESRAEDDEFAAVLQVRDKPSDFYRCKLKHGAMIVSQCPACPIRSAQLSFIHSPPETRRVNEAHTVSSLLVFSLAYFHAAGSDVGGAGPAPGRGEV